jgi:hypothetical protein
VRTVAAVGISLANPKTDWTRYISTPAVRSELPVGLDFLKANGPRSFWLYTCGRWLCIAFSLLGGCLCFRWASRLYGAAAGLTAGALWCFSPYVLGHASLITPDAHAAAIGLAAGYTFWCWLREPCWDRAILAGLVLGLAELTKFTLLVFYPLWLVIWVVYRLPERRQMYALRSCREIGQLSAIMLLSVFIINVGYGFEGSFQRIGDYWFQSRAMTGTDSLASAPVGNGNRFTGTWLAALPMPLPKNYLQGIDAQKLDFERGFDSYLCGEWKMDGWWYYYLYALAIKIPLGTWAMFSLAVGASLFARGYSDSWRDEMVLLLPAAAILVLVSSQTGFSIHSRYVLPMLPFVFVWMSKVGRCIQFRHWKLAAVAGAALCWSVGSSLWYYPHSLSYFNELVGGPKNGHAHLLESNIAWGQDLFYLKKWLDGHPEAAPLHLASFGWVNPRLAGIEFTLPPLGPDLSRPATETRGEFLGPHPGWYAIDVNHLHGIDGAVVDERGELRNPAGKDLNYSYFQHFQPVATAGYSIYIYHISLDEANRVRKELGLPELRVDCWSPEHGHAVGFLQRRGDLAGGPGGRMVRARDAGDHPPLLRDPPQTPRRIHHAGADGLGAHGNGRGVCQCVSRVGQDGVHALQRPASYGPRAGASRGPALRQRCRWYDEWQQRPASVRQDGLATVVSLEIGPQGVGCVVAERE